MTMQGWDELAAHIKAHDVSGSISAQRQAFAALAPAPVAGENVSIDGLPCLAVGPASDEQPIIWVHGGGLVFGSPQTHSAMAADLAWRTGTRVLLPRYRLAPEHPWPAPLNDVLDVIDASDGPTQLVGDSAGGMVALLATLRRPGKVSRLALLSPNTDRTGLSQTRVDNSPTDLMNEDASDRDLAKKSFGDQLSTHPDASPIFANLSTLPPVWLTAATNEVLLDDSLMLLRRMGQYGINVEAHILGGLCHLWMMWPYVLPQFDPLFASLARFMTMPDAYCPNTGTSSSSAALLA